MDAISGKLLTIFVPVFGEAPFLNSSLESLQEFYNNVEIIVLEDYPAEPSNSDIVSSFGFEHVKHPKNLGLVGNFNFARSFSKTPFFMIIGPDDEITGNSDNLSEALSDYLSRKTVLYLDTTVINELGDEVSSEREFAKRLISRFAGQSSKNQLCSLMIGYWPYSPSIIWPSSAIHLIYRNEYMLVADFCLLAEHLLEGYTFEKLKTNAKFRYRRHQGSMSGNSEAWIKTRREEILLYRNLRKIMFEKRFFSAFVFSFFQISSRLLSLKHGLSSMLSQIRNKGGK